MINLQQAVDLLESHIAVPASRSIPPLLVVLVGLPGTGKSTLARTLAQALPAAVVESDYVRKQLFISPTHSGEESQIVHRVAHTLMRRLLRRGISVVDDATNLIESQRELLYRLADQCEARLLVVRVIAPETVVQQRLEQRQMARSPEDWSDATWDVYVRMRQRADPIARSYATVNTAEELSLGVNKVLRIARRLQRG